MEKMKILCLHGFLGGPSDFDFLKDEYELITPDLNQYVHLDFKGLYSKIMKDFNLIPAQTVILGYSFGARLGLRFLYQCNDFNRIICLAGHMGLNDDNHKRERALFETSIIDKMKTVSEADFLREWNQYDIFKGDTIDSVRYSSKSIYYFLNYGLSKQPFLKEELLPLRHKIQFYYGELDAKYCEYAKNNLNQYRFQLLPGIGHRIIHQHQLVKDILHEVTS